MCTAVSFLAKDHYFGRNLDLEYHYEEAVTIVPRRFPLPFRHMDSLSSHYAFIGMATTAGGYPLFYDATNEHGLSIAALNFPSNAVYQPETAGKRCIAPFELIPWLLAQCKSLHDVRALLDGAVLAAIPFSESFPLTPLHFMISCGPASLVAEPMADGLHLYDNPVGVLTNNPPFEVQRQLLADFMQLSPAPPQNRFSPRLSLHPYSHGMGAFGLPGDLSSRSRFARAAFTLHNALCPDEESACVSQFFHILQSVAQPRGCTRTPGGEYEITVYSSCCNTDQGIYYYTTYDNQQITAVRMQREDLNAKNLIRYPLVMQQQIRFEN